MESKKFNRSQIKVWQDFLKKNTYPKFSDLEYLSKVLGIKTYVIQSWFQARFNPLICLNQSSLVDQAKSVTIYPQDSHKLPKFLGMASVLLNRKLPPQIKIEGLLYPYPSLLNLPSTSSSTDLGQNSPKNSKSGKSTKNWTKFTGFKFYLNKLLKCPGIIDYENKVMHITVNDERFTADFTTGHLLHLTTKILQEFLGKDLSTYTLTGQRQMRVEGKLTKVKEAAIKLPDELAYKVKEFILKSHILIQYPEITDNFDGFFNTLVTKVLNRVADKMSKRRKAAEAKMQQNQIPTISVKENIPPSSSIIVPFEKCVGEIKDDSDSS